MRIQGQGRSRMDHHVNPLHGALDRLPITDIAPHFADDILLRVIKWRNVQRDHMMPLRQQGARHVDAQKAGPSGNQIGSCAMVSLCSHTRIRCSFTM
jgi:hypothetical protein